MALTSELRAERQKRLVTVVLAAVGGLAVGATAYYFVERHALSGGVVPLDPASVVAAPGRVPERRPPFSLPDLDGVSQPVSKWDGQVLVINFWATWCVPCREEIPIFVELQAQYAPRGLQFVGVAIDELENVRRFHEDFGMNYPTLHGQAEAMEIASLYGNSIGGLPYTVVIDREGRVVFSKLGPLERAEAESSILAHL